MLPHRLFSLLRFVAGLATISAGFVATSSSGAESTTQEFHFKRGLSIGHWQAKYSNAAGYGGDWFGEADVKWIADHGFDHIRVPVDGRVWLRPDGGLDEAKVALFLHAVEWAHARGMGTILDMHFLPGGTYGASQDPAIFTTREWRDVAAQFWATVTRRLSDQGAWLRFEIINEPMAPTNAQLNELQRAALASIRNVDAQRVVYMTSNLSSAFSTFSELDIPDDPHVAIVLHYDEPMIFTHQRASWKHCPPDMPLVTFPGRVPDMSKAVPADHFAAKESGRELTKADVVADFVKIARQIAQRAPGKEVLLGEFGSYEQAPAESRRVYTATVRDAAEREGWGWTLWDYKSSFGVRTADGATTAALDGILSR